LPTPVLPLIAAFYGYLWVGVFTLFKQLRKQEIEAATATAAEATALTAPMSTAALEANESEPRVGPDQPWISEDYLDDPPSYVLAVQVSRFNETITFILNEIGLQNVQIHTYHMCLIVKEQFLRFVNLSKSDFKK
jgi:hypothetical protein